MGSVPQYRWRNIGLVLLAWTVIGVFFFSQGLVQKAATHDPSPWWHYLVTWLTGVYLSAALTPAILWAGRRYRIERRNWVRRSAIHMVFSLVFGVGELAIHSALIPWMGLFPTTMTSFPIALAILMTISFH